MKDISAIYKEYRIAPSLQMHMLRVAAVAKIVLSHLREPLGESEEAHVLSACLFHDIGNIVKFDLNYFPEFIQPEGLAYWQDVQKHFWEKYGTEQHEAHMAIGKELGLHPRTLLLIGAVGAKFACGNRQSEDMAKKICSYGDVRVDPHGIVSLSERITEAQLRYKDRISRDDDVSDDIHQCFYAIEKQLMEKTDITPEFITNAIAEDIISQLRSYVPV